MLHEWADDQDMAGHPVRPTGEAGPARGPGHSGTHLPRRRQDSADPGGQGCRPPCRCLWALWTRVWGCLAEAFATHCRPGTHRRGGHLSERQAWARAGNVQLWPLPHCGLTPHTRSVPAWHCCPLWHLAMHGPTQALAFPLSEQQRLGLPSTGSTEDRRPSAPAPSLGGGLPLQAPLPPPPRAKGWWALPRQLPGPAASARLVQSRSTKGGSLFKCRLLAVFLQLSGVPTLRFSSDNYVPFHGPGNPEPRAWRR